MFADRNNVHDIAGELLRHHELPRYRELRVRVLRLGLDVLDVSRPGAAGLCALLRRAVSSPVVGLTLCHK